MDSQTIRDVCSRKCASNKVSKEKGRLKTGKLVFRRLFVQAKPDSDSAPVFQPSMQLLHAVHAQVVAAFCAFAHGFAAGDGGVLRHALGEGGAADAVAVGDGLRRAG